MTYPMAIAIHRKTSTQSEGLLPVFMPVRPLEESATWIRSFHLPPFYVKWLAKFSAGFPD
jgi:hypothetical protein